MVERCGECGFEYDLDGASGAGSAIAAGAVEIAHEVSDQHRDVRSRRDPLTWSPLEYACHVRDVLLVQRERVFLARRVECPRPEPMGREERADYDGYDAQDPIDVARQLVDAARMFERVLARLGPNEWNRTIIYNYPTPSERSLRWVAVHTLHEVRHHALDVHRQM
jgi:hypothetical protein